MQSGIARLLNFFPDADWRDADRDEYNRQTEAEWSLIRDFLVLHYNATERTDTAFWRHCRSLPLPDTLAARLSLWRGSGRLQRMQDDLFAESSWLQVLVGQGWLPEGRHALATLLDDADGARFSARSPPPSSALCRQTTHADYIARHCAVPRA